VGDVLLQSWSEVDLPLLEQMLGDPDMMTHLGGPESPEQILQRHQRYLRLPETDHMFKIVWGSNSEAEVVIEQACLEHRHQFMHAFPSVTNSASNAICRKFGFSLIEECQVEYPPGNFLIVNDWRFDLFRNEDPQNH
jgi:hypothetical protein